MTAIADIVYSDQQPVDPGILERMKNILEPYGRDAQHIWHEPGVGLLRTLCRITPEDAVDLQTFKSADGNRLLVFDGRIDNRKDLADTLDIQPRHRRSSSIARFHDANGVVRNEIV